MDPTAALKQGNYAALARWLFNGGFAPDWTQHPQDSESFRQYLLRNSSTQSRIVVAKHFFKSE